MDWMQYLEAKWSINGSWSLIENLLDAEMCIHLKTVTSVYLQYIGIFSPLSPFHICVHVSEIYKNRLHQKLLFKFFHEVMAGKLSFVIV